MNKDAGYLASWAAVLLILVGLLFLLDLGAAVYTIIGSVVIGCAILWVIIRTAVASALRQHRKSLASPAPSASDTPAPQPSGEYDSAE
jgi:hypothetical protein